jgi:hypothetical protein
MGSKYSIIFDKEEIVRKSKVLKESQTPKEHKGGSPLSYVKHTWIPSGRPYIHKCTVCGLVKVDKKRAAITYFRNDIEVENKGCIKSPKQTHKCCGKLRSGNICGKNAKYKITYDNEVRYVCGVHTYEYELALEYNKLYLDRGEYFKVHEITIEKL